MFMLLMQFYLNQTEERVVAVKMMDQTEQKETGDQHQNQILVVVVVRLFVYPIDSKATIL